MHTQHESKVGKAMITKEQEIYRKWDPAGIEPAIHTIIIRLTHANVWESMGKPCSCMQFIKSRIFYCKSRENPYQYYKSRENPYQYYKSRENPYQVLQVTRAASERAMKSKVRMIKSLSP